MPSPDWFTGFSDISAVDSSTDTWYDEFVIESLPWDAGTDDGTTYTSADAPTIPAGPIYEITEERLPISAAFFSPDGSSVDPVARWTCTVTEVPPDYSPVEAPVMNPISFGPPSSATPTPSESATGAPTSPTLETGAPASSSVETGAPASSSVETGAPTSAPLETGAPTPTPLETGAPTSTPLETGTPTSAPLKTGVPTSTPPETGAPIIETGTPTSTSIDTGVPTILTSSPTSAPTGNVEAPSGVIESESPVDMPSVSTPSAGEAPGGSTVSPTVGGSMETSDFPTAEESLEISEFPTVEDSAETTDSPTMEAPSDGTDSPTIMAPSDGTDSPTIMAPSEGTDSPTIMAPSAFEPSDFPVETPSVFIPPVYFIPPSPSAFVPTSDSPVESPILPLTPAGYLEPQPVGAPIESPVSLPVGSEDCELLGGIVGDGFGETVLSSTTSGDGSTVAVMSIDDFYGTDNNVRVRVYRFDSEEEVWFQIGEDIFGDSNMSEEGVGTSVALSNDGNTVAIGLFSDSCDRGILSVTCGRVRVCFYDGRGWIYRGEDIIGEQPNDLTGYALSMSDDGLRLAIGAPTNYGDNGVSVGLVRLFEFSSDGNWAQLGADIEGDANWDYFGSSVALSGDGRVLACGAVEAMVGEPGYVKIYQYEESTSSFVQLGANIGETLTDRIAFAVSLSYDGLILALGAIPQDGVSHGSGRTGVVNVYRYEDEAWILAVGQIESGIAGERFGYSVSLNADGTVLGVGAPGSDSNPGSASLYDLDGSLGTWSRRAEIIQPGGAYIPSGIDWGRPVAISSDGIIYAVGDRRGVYVFECFMESSSAAPSPSPTENASPAPSAGTAAPSVDPETGFPTSTPIETGKPTSVPIETAAPTSTPLETGTPTNLDPGTGTPTSIVSETEMPSSTTFETGRPTSTSLETGTPTATTIETGTPTSTPLETETPTATTIETGTPTSASIETGTSTAAALETGTPTLASIETGTPTAASIKTGTPTSTPRETGTPTSASIETGTPTVSPTLTPETASPNVSPTGTPETASPISPPTVTSETASPTSPLTVTPETASPTKIPTPSPSKSLNIDPTPTPTESKESPSPGETASPAAATKTGSPQAGESAMRVIGYETDSPYGGETSGPVAETSVPYGGESNAPNPAPVYVG